MINRFIAQRYSNCPDCGEIIEPGDPAGYLKDRDGAMCSECLEVTDDPHEDSGDLSEPFWN